MPFLLSHSLAGTALGVAPFPERVPKRIWWLAPLCAAIPDLDTVWGYRMVGSDSWFAHRGITHTPVFAGLLAALVVKLAFPEVRSGKERWRLWAALCLATLSHGLLDALSGYGAGIPFCFPFSTERYFFRWRPITASPDAYGHGIARLLLKSIRPELLWIWLPAAFLLGLSTWRRSVRRHAAPG
ncbi:MAG TPA: metal-dependent hydrolase [Gemmatimonadales bacterium]|nr:metal-dependent hydrolase [Gemmatimonadales bacterium]